MKKIIVDATGIQKEVDLTPEEIKYNEEQNKIWEDGKYDRELNNFRLARNNLLLKSDWTDLPHAPLTDEKKIEWQSYRIELRDITNGLDTVEKVEAVEFPTKPSGE